MTIYYFEQPAATWTITLHYCYVEQPNQFFEVQSLKYKIGRNHVYANDESFNFHLPLLLRRLRQFQSV